MPDPPVALTVAGATYRVFSSVSSEELQRLARILDDRILSFDPHAELTHSQALLYAALALTHELEQERAIHHRAQTATRQSLAYLLECIDATLGQIPTTPVPREPATPLAPEASEAE